MTPASVLRSSKSFQQLPRSISYQPVRRLASAANRGLNAAKVTSTFVGYRSPLPSPQPLYTTDIPPWRLERPSFSVPKAAQTLPPDHTAVIRDLQTFALPDAVTGSKVDKALGKELIEAWRKDGILQIQFPPDLQVLSDAIKQSEAFFSLKHEDKAKCVDSQSFAGYIASGEEITDGIADYSEIFTVTKDLQQTDARVQAKWPCHGPNPWPEGLPNYSSAIGSLMKYKGEIGEKLLTLTALGLGLEDPLAFNKLTQDGWHHMRVLRFPPTNRTNGKGKTGRGIGSHTDYGLLVIAAQDEVGGLFIRPPIEGEHYANWERSAAGAHENDDKWVYVAPMENVFTVFPGVGSPAGTDYPCTQASADVVQDMMQYMTNSYLPSTPHKVGLNTRERYAFAYFHEPNFNAECKTLPKFRKGSKADEGAVHYGTHFTNMFMRNYPERITAKRMVEEKRMDLLKPMRKEHGFSFDK